MLATSVIQAIIYSRENKISGEALDFAHEASCSGERDAWVHGWESIGLALGLKDSPGKKQIWKDELSDMVDGLCSVKKKEGCEPQISHARDTFHLLPVAQALGVAVGCRPGG